MYQECARCLGFNVSMIANVMCQLDWAMCLHIWSNVILCVSVRLFLDETNFWTPRLIKQMPFPCISGLHPISGRPEYNKKSDSPMNKRIRGTPAVWLLSSRDMVFLAFRLKLHHQLSWVSNLLPADLGTCQPQSSLSPSNKPLSLSLSLFLALSCSIYPPISIYPIDPVSLKSSE